MNEIEFITNPDCQMAVLILMPMTGMIFYCLEMIRGILKGQTNRPDKAALLDLGHLCQAQVIWHETTFDTVLDASTEYSKVLSELTQDLSRNRQICNDVAGDDCRGIKLVLSDRRDHCTELHRILKEDHGIEAHVLTGGLTVKEREVVTDEITASTVKVLICTGQLIGEGYDLPALETLFLPCGGARPFSQGKGLASTRMRESRRRESSGTRFSTRLGPEL